MEDRLLIWRFRHGRVEVLRRMYEKYSDDMVTLAAALVRNKAGAEDVVHDVFVTLARSAGGLDHVRNLKAYLLTCTANRAKELLASGKRQVNSPADDPAARYDQPIDTMINDETHRRLLAAMDQLPLDQQEAILLHVRGGLTFKEIAGHQNVSINTVQGRYRYGLDKLRSMLNGEVIK